MENTQKITKIREWLGTGSINIFGRPFAGKDTHGRELETLLDGVLLGGGDILRNSVVPEHVKECLRVGKLIPTEDYIEIVLPYLSQDKFAQKPLILSSVGRWHGEEDGVLHATEEAGHPTKAVIYLNVDEDTIRERWHLGSHLNDRGGRDDDTEEVLEIRLHEYREKTLPVLDYYRNSGLLIDVDGTLDKHIVLDNIIDTLYALATATR
jgi:adenylate kinase